MKRTAIFAVAAAMAAASFAEPYTRLFKVHNPTGDCRVLKPGAAAFEPAQRDKAYPFGTQVECGKDSDAVLLFSEADAVRILADTSVKVTIGNGDAAPRIVSLENGTALTRIGASTAEDFVVIDTPAGRVRSIVGNCKVSVARTKASKREPAMVDVELSAESSSKMKFIGRQFIIPSLKNGFGARISSNADDSYTVVTDTLGDYHLLITAGLEADPPEPYEENSELNRLKLNSQSAVRIWREKASVGGTTVVAVLATTPAGKGRESFAFAVGKSDIAARSNVFLDTITNELAAAEAARAAAGDDDAEALGGNDDDFDSLDDLGGDSAPAAPAASDDNLFDFL